MQESTLHPQPHVVQLVSKVPNSAVYPTESSRAVVSLNRAGKSAIMLTHCWINTHIFFNEQFSSLIPGYARWQSPDYRCPPPSLLISHRSRSPSKCKAQSERSARTRFPFLNWRFPRISAEAFSWTVPRSSRPSSTYTSACSIRTFWSAMETGELELSQQLSYWITEFRLVTTCLRPFFVCLICAICWSHQTDNVQLEICFTNDQNWINSE